MREGGAHRIVTPNEQTSATYDELLKTETGGAADFGQAPSRRIAPWLIGLNVGLIALAAVLYFRFRKAKP